MDIFKKIELYHAGTDKISKPLVSFGRPDVDFGPGFYLTDLYVQAEAWARSRGNKRGKPPIINKYIFDREAFFKDDKFKKLVFLSYDEEWLEFVVGNRLSQSNWKGFDYIEGGVADDRVVDTVDLYFSGFIDKNEAIRRLQYLKPNNQICISNQDVIDKYLEFIEAEEL